MERIVVFWEGDPPPRVEPPTPNLRLGGPKGNTVKRPDDWRLKGAAILAAGALVWGACEKPRPAAEGEPRLVAVDMILSVNNRTRQAKTIYLLAADGEHLLGRVESMGSSTFSLSGSVAETPDSIRLEAREGRAATGIQSHRFRIARGQQSIWTFVGSGAGAIATR